MHYQFHKDLSVGEKFEGLVVERLKVVEPTFKFHGFSNNKDWDILFSLHGITYTLEVKTDFHTHYTNNVMIEYESRGKPSGISTSKANFLGYVVVTGEGTFSLFIINTKRLRTLITEKAYHRDISGGDIGSRTKMYMFSLDVLKENAKEL